MHHLVLFIGMVQQPHRIFAMIARQTNEVVQHHPFVCGRCLSILRDHLSENFAPQVQTRSHLHRPPSPSRSLGRIRCHNDSDICSCLIQNLPVSSHDTTYSLGEILGNSTHESQENGWKRICFRKVSGEAMRCRGGSWKGRFRIRQFGAKRCSKTTQLSFNDVSFGP